jgi:acetone carboxylase gamma subunit
MPEEEWSQIIKTEAPTVVDEEGRIVNRTTVEFMCPECQAEFDVEVTLPWKNVQ